VLNISGSKNIGIAISDNEGEMAFPKTILQNNERVILELRNLIESENVQEVVLGDSTNYHGEENPIMEDVHRFKKNLELQTSVPIYFEPEILSTQEARRGQEDVKKVDSGAATIILQSYIDKHKT